MLKVSNIAVSLDEKDYAKVIANTLNIRKSQVKNVKIAKKAVDARRKNKVHFNMGFTFEYVDEDQLLKTHSKQVSKVKEYHYDKLTPNNQTIMVVGSGPAGLFCAYNLARSGQKVILIEQGKCVDERKKDIDTYLETGKLNTQSNVQFGEGGAGTFSDGKLTTGIKDYRKQFVLNTFYEHGASEDILYLNKPHLGTDVLINVVKNIRKDIEKCGDVRFETKLVDIIIEDNQLKEELERMFKNKNLDEISQEEMRENIFMLHQVYDGGNVDTAYSTFPTTIEKTTKNNNENSMQSTK